MTLHRAIANSPAEATLAAQFAVVRGATPSTWREAAFRRFEQAGLPTRRVEAWHYTDLRAALTSPLPIAGAPGAAAIEAARGVLAALTRVAATRFVLVDGHYIAALSDAPPPGVSLAPAAPEAPAVGELDAMAALNVALATGGCAIAIEPGADAPPIEVVHTVTPGAGGLFAPRDQPGRRRTRRRGRALRGRRCGDAAQRLDLDRPCGGRTGLARRLDRGRRRLAYRKPDRDPRGSCRA